MSSIISSEVEYLLHRCQNTLLKVTLDFPFFFLSPISGGVRGGFMTCPLAVHEFQRINLALFSI